MNERTNKRTNKYYSHWPQNGLIQDQVIVGMSTNPKADLTPQRKQTAAQKGQPKTKSDVVLHLELEKEKASLYLIKRSRVPIVTVWFQEQRTKRQSCSYEMKCYKSNNSNENDIQETDEGVCSV